MDNVELSILDFCMIIKVHSYWLRLSFFTVIYLEALSRGEGTCWLEMVYNISRVSNSQGVGCSLLIYF